MGLDIYFHKVKRVRKSRMEPFTMTVKECSELNDKRVKDKYSRYAKKALARLSAAKDKAEYEAVYKEIFPKGMKKFTSYEWHYSKFLKEVKPYAEVEKFINDFKDWVYAEDDAYFRKVNCVYAYFAPKLQDEVCFVTRADIEVLIGRCEEILKGLDLRKEIPMEKIELAERLLPTQDGFFFGSIEYDKWYFRDLKNVRSQMKKLLRGFNEDTDVIYVVMSW